MIPSQIQHLKDNIASVCQRLGRNPQEVTIVAVTKFAPVELIEQALACGVTHIGENRVQEGEKKYLGLSQKSIVKHMIGHLQTNKVKDALNVFDVIQSVDSLKLALAIQKEAALLKRRVEIFVQVNTSQEEQKFGVNEKDAIPLVKEISKLDNIFISGLMTIGPLSEDEIAIRGCFQRLRALRDSIQNDFSHLQNVSMKFLSMGMTNDYPIALEEGANMLRIGRAIFATHS